MRNEEVLTRAREESKLEYGSDKKKKSMLVGTYTAYKLCTVKNHRGKDGNKRRRGRRTIGSLKTLKAEKAIG